MKRIAFLLICLLFLTSCKNDDTISTNDIWNLVNINGGFAGIDKNFNVGEIVWSFNEQNSTLVIKKTTNSSFSGLNEGTYPYTIQEINNVSFISIDNSEYFQIIISSNQLSIDENIRPGGTGADGFIFQFEK